MYLGLVGAGVKQGDVLVLAISGGPDSMALLDIVRQLQPQEGWRLVVAHIDHGLRTESKREAKLVENYCEQYNLDGVVQTLKLPLSVRRQLTRVEETARELRYQALRQIARRVKAQFIVTAHNADDQVETIILNFLRGSGIKGLGGMRSVSGDIIRPWLTVPKADLLSYVKRHKISFAIDTTNASTKFTRNRVRHKLLPILREYNPNLDELLLKNSQLFLQADMTLRNLARELLGLMGTGKSGKVNLSISRLSELLPLMQVEVVKQAVEQVAGTTYNWKGSHFMEIAKLITSRSPNNQKRLPGKLLVRRAYDTITISQE
ncbi:tRNA lysidine(34) synthetase TilS [candidate division Kazan bacterium RIFCSPHIGHO2_01_FULL_44_14]|uniref:tRNA(Ile)-lysidine synthase n=1 Tax=candidate division Kazan bacterium RIFCSPLOWO2_01_FULL_45_19 TaxID=1798538 RepID=A0A1F4NQH0_UNCK3|nr:MAG: tRNA lysidine(34) synthetase TilS [candidate division Kazan bacterium RIFCSPLOWO2_01_FULL_45_19]OGB77944.1 MAG: tRNA lysidine(34) synthetase TilS [candidate division Kazan bacterium RIFCSPHIGHO2_01_FULL_44_14]